MKQSLEWFLCAASISRYYGYKKPVSMLVHTSQKQLDHKAVANAIKKWLLSDRNTILSECKKLYLAERDRFTKKILREKYPDYEHPDEEIWDYPEFDSLEKGIRELLSKVTSIMMDEEGELQYSRGLHLCIDNCANNGLTDDGMHMRLAYPDDKNPNYPDYSTAFIVVGGNTLSRGLTLEGLVSTYFLRSVKQADTLMQMGRWFGYRPHYELLQRVWLTNDTSDKFAFLSDVDADLREQIYQMQIGKNKKYKIEDVDAISWPTTSPFKNHESIKKPEGIIEELTVQYWFDKNHVTKHPNGQDVFSIKSHDRFITIPEGKTSGKSFKRLHRWRYSPTAAYGNNEVHLHPYEPRRISVAEALAIQSLPEEFTLPANLPLSVKFKMVGNGVPYLLAYGIAKELYDWIDNQIHKGE